MAEAYTYTEATNIVVNTGGTSSVPSTLAGFVTADRAGTATLLVATAGLSPTLALTYQVRPVDVIALLITFTVAAKTAEADHIFITGTDWRDAAQTEAIDVTAGNGTYVSTKYFRTITNIDCSDNAAGGGTQWADGTVAVTQPQWGVIWDLLNGHYHIDSKLEIGNGSTSTYFASESESVSFNSAAFISWRCPYNVKAAATLRIGKQVNGEPAAGSRWAADDLTAFASAIISENSATAVLEIYGSIVAFEGTTSTGKDYQGVTKVQDSMMYTTVFSGWQFTKTTSEFDNVLLSDGTLYWFAQPDVLTRVHHDKTGYGGIGNQTAGLALTVTEPEVTNPVYSAYTYRNANTGTLTVRDPNLLPTAATLTHNNAASTTYLQFSVDIHVADKDGVSLENVSVLCEDSIGGGSVVGGFSAKVTDASGDIASQYIYRQKWYGTSKTETDYSPHKFTLSKAGYETLILEAITVDAPIVWHLELQDPVSAGAAGISARNKHIGIGVSI